MAEKKDKGCWDNKDCDKKSGIKDFNPLKPFNKGQFHFSIWYFVAIVAAIIIINMFVTTPKETILEYSVFKEKVKSGEIKRVEIGESYYIGFTATSETMAQNKSSRTGSGQSPAVIQYRTTPVNDPGFVQLLDEQSVEYYSNMRKTNPFVSFLLSWLLPIGALILIWRVMFRRMGNIGTDVMSFGKNKSLIVAEGETGVRFDDVAGVEEAKDELVEVVDFLEHPTRYTAIGGKIPKGVLLVGAPGTGKTMLAKAVAGEAGVPFFRLSGADFVEMFVGVGAARVRDLFRQAREKSPCIIFIDELDAIGKTRATAMTTNDEREQTLNQLLVEMDGFDSRTGVIILAATNRPEILDPALLRPGRFDRQVLVDKPDLKGREEILKIHAKDVKIHMEVDFNKVARSTPGLVGADLANIVNEAALLAVRANRTEVLQEDFEEAIEKVIAGLRKKNKLIDKDERKRVAYHETGHAVTAYFTKGADPVQKISIVPRGYGALGYTMQLPEEEKYLLTEDELFARVDVLLGGRVCEEIIFGNVSTGASDDLSKASDIIRKMITDYGMSEKFKNVYLPHQKGYQFLDSQVSLQKEYSEATQQYVDEETARIVSDRYGRVRELLSANQQAIHRVTEALLKEEMLDAESFKGLMAA